VFRPSTRSENSITLTWKFFKKHFVHIDILEQEKPQGAAIGKRLLISNDSFENLREIIERYIIPCNRLVREVTSHTKFLDAESFIELEERVKEEKKE
jgi:transcription elongation factor SPT6